VRMFQGAKVPHLELSLPGANGLGSEKSIIRLEAPGGTDKLSTPCHLAKDEHN